MGLSNDVDDAVRLRAMLGDEETNSLRGIRSPNLKVIHGGRAVREYIRFHFRRKCLRFSPSAYAKTIGVAAAKLARA
jgi:hypothetical protein